ncbi:MAG TPA: YraN family protein [Hyphomicrobiaceae bacterium]|nr:YraN family protein [Hyphomicrobiaceae bacterium]
MTDTRDPSPARVERYRRGRIAEIVAAAFLLAKGYRILARRWRSPYGEIDLIARRGRRLAFVEVKRRPTQADAQAAITPRQSRRYARAAEFWISRHPAFAEHERALDIILVSPLRVPLHIEHGLQLAWPAGRVVAR